MLLEGHKANNSRCVSWSALVPAQTQTHSALSRPYPPGPQSSGSSASWSSALHLNLGKLYALSRKGLFIEHVKYGAPGTVLEASSAELTESYECHCRRQAIHQLLEASLISLCKSNPIFLDMWVKVNMGSMYRYILMSCMFFELKPPMALFSPKIRMWAGKYLLTYSRMSLIHFIMWFSYW